jgi:hypothetical protein
MLWAVMSDGMVIIRLIDVEYFNVKCSMQCYC